MKIGNISAEQLAEQYGTPLYVYDASVIKDRFNGLKNSMIYPKSKIYYSVKANTNPEILKLLKDEGLDGVDTVSIGEAEICLEAGFQPEQITFTNTSLSESDLRRINDLGINFEADSISQLKKWMKIKSDEGVRLRINPGTGFGHHDHVNTGKADSKFGIYSNEIDEAKRIADEVIGLHQHAGCGVLEAETFLHTLPTIYETAKKFDTLESLNVGGGLGIPYLPGQKALDIDKFGSKLSDDFKRFTEDYGQQLDLYVEPGRYFVAESGYLLATVNTIKQNHYRKFVAVDTGFHHLLRPILYEAHHKIINASNSEGEKESIWLAGNVCEAGDLLTEEREVTKVSEGDIIAILNAGAYGYTMASNYMSMKKPAEVLVEDDNSRQIRERL